MPLDNIQKTRIKKLEALKKSGVNPYPIYTHQTHNIKEVLADFDDLSDAKTKVVLCGRLRSVREHGGLTFFHFEDETGAIQSLINREKIGQKKYQFFSDTFDVGDFIEVSGALFVTKRGEKSVEADDFRILAKSLLPLPEKWHGLQEVEERFRKRYLDLVMSPEIKEKFRTRSKIIKEIRRILDDCGFLEVETPILQPIPGGARAKPFKTKLNALKMDLYLRVSPELYLKRLLIGGLEKVYEIGRCFRNEGMDKHHNPDFTMLEFYWAYQNRDGLMNFVEKMTLELVNKITGGSEIVYEGKKINFKTPWLRVNFKDIDFEKEKSGLIQPTFVIDHPAHLAVLAKTKENDPKKADRFQTIIGGIELMNGFSELNDPIEQKKRFKAAKIETEREDKDFLEAQQYGMPPAAGIGIGIDRLVALLTDSHALREVILFPTMKTK